jgi:hypothetical protein
VRTALGMDISLGLNSASPVLERIRRPYLQEQPGDIHPEVDE